MVFTLTERGEVEIWRFELDILSITQGQWCVLTRFSMRDGNNIKKSVRIDRSNRGKNSKLYIETSVD